MNPKNERSLTPRDLARVLFRHGRTMALFFGGVMLLTLLLIALYPRSYSSEAKLFLRIGRESVALDPTVTTGPINLLQKSQADEVNSALNILNSRAVLERVVECVGARRILDITTTRDSQSVDPQSRGRHRRPRCGVRQRVRQWRAADVASIRPVFRS